MEAPRDKEEELSEEPEADAELSEEPEAEAPAPRTRRRSVTMGKWGIDMKKEESVAARVQADRDKAMVTAKSFMCEGSLS